VGRLKKLHDGAVKTKHGPVPDTTGPDTVGPRLPATLPQNDLSGEQY
jgi:hypothetical protein